MIHDLCISLAMRLRVPGRSLYEAECLAMILMLQLVLLFALAGFRISGAENDDGTEVLPRVPFNRVAGNRCGILPARAGTAEYRFRTLLD